ncbi:ThuA domain-containing protein [Zavarzinella formosa]|uniref:ThuA domain-containing protein n=1 Tax=Zavarzinella formosa TaxID=360055 RepID=UPI00031A3D29|nr:ThuA domain-containing protein [Zavarzinella formosa]
MFRQLFFATTLLLFPLLGQAAEPAFPVEELPKDAKAVKVVLIAGTNFYKTGEHDYIAAVRVLADLLKQSGVAPVIALDWPKKPETLAGAKAILFLSDGAEKHALLKDNRLAEITKLAESGTGLVFLHQTLDFPKDFLDRGRTLTGGVWEKGISQRAHWVTTFDTFTNHPITQGVTPFKIDDGWLYKLTFGAERKNLTPLLKTVSPKTPAKGELGDDAIVGWAFERPTGGKTFSFTGAHLHASFAEEGYRRFLVNGILWSAGVAIPKEGAPVKLEPAELPKYLTPAPAKK